MAFGASPGSVSSTTAQRVSHLGSTSTTRPSPHRPSAGECTGERHERSFRGPSEAAWSVRLGRGLGQTASKDLSEAGIVPVRVAGARWAAPCRRRNEGQP
jgi:hypothetical protein